MGGLPPQIQQFQYPSAQVPTPFDVALDWLVALAQPIRRAALPVAVAVASGLFTPLMPLDDINWFQANAQPVRKIGQPASVIASSSGLTMPVPFEATAETITLDNWHSPLSQPVRRTVGRQPEASTWNSFTPSQLSFDWFAGLTQPTPLRKGISATQQDPVAFVAVIDTSPTAGTGTSIPHLTGGLPPQAQSFQYPSVQGPVPIFTEIVTLDKWASPLVQPVPRRVVLQVSTAAFVPTGDDAPAVVTSTLIPYQAVSLPPQAQWFQYPSITQVPIPLPLIGAAPQTAADIPYLTAGLPPQIRSFQYPSRTHVVPWLSAPVLLWTGDALDAKPDADLTFDSSAGTGAIVTEQLSSDAGFSSIYTTLTHTLTAPEVAAETADLTWTDPSLVDGIWYMRAKITDGGMDSPWSNTETITIAANAVAGTGTSVPYRISAGLPPQVRTFQYPSVQAPVPVVAAAVSPAGTNGGVPYLTGGLPPQFKRFQYPSRQAGVASWLSAPVLLWNPITSDITPDFDVTFDLSAGVGATITWEIATDSGFASIVATYSDTLDSAEVLAGLVQVSATALSTGTYYARAKVTDGGMVSPWSNTEVVTILSTMVGAGTAVPYAAGGLPPQVKSFQYPVIASPVPLVPIETVTLDKWFSPLAQPIRRVRSVASQPSLTWSTFAPQSFDWFKPLSLPTRRTRAITPSSLLWSGFTPTRDPPGLDKWFHQYAQPTRRVRAIAPSSLLWSNFTPPPEITQLGKWFRPLETPPRARRGLSTADQKAHFLVKAAPFEGEDDQGEDEDNRGGAWWLGEHYDHLGKAHRKRKAEIRAAEKRILQTIARTYNELKGIVEDAPEGIQDELQAEVAAIIQPVMLVPVVELPQASYIDFGLLADRTKNIEAILAQMIEEIRLRIEDEEEDDDLLLFA